MTRKRRNRGPCSQMMADRSISMSASRCSLMKHVSVVNPLPHSSLLTPFLAVPFLSPPSSQFPPLTPFPTSPSSQFPPVIPFPTAAPPQPPCPPGATSLWLCTWSKIMLYKDIHMFQSNPSLISLLVFVDVKRHVYLLTYFSPFWDVPVLLSSPGTDCELVYFFVEQKRWKLMYVVYLISVRVCWLAFNFF